ncbi:iron ABC transporter permease [Prevotella sp. HCN-7019]|uniref:iron ABC transporter permease n=1 Tax=Prevotella sp. HCN-7019 TaxID=3134668 RepID=UPI0030C3ED8C
MKAGGLLILLLVGGVIAVIVLNLFIGSVSIPSKEVFKIIMGQETVKSSWRFIVLDSRLPQAITAVLCGASLSLSGLLLQTVFRNPLADPSVFGISSGAGLGVALVMLLWGGSMMSSVFCLAGFVAIFSAAFLGAMFMTFLILFVATKVRNSILLIIIGIMIGYIASSAITMLNFFATDEGVKSYVVWGMGNFSSVSSVYLPLFSIIVVLSVVASALLIKPLNVFLLGDAYAENLGVNVVRLRNAVLFITGLLVAVSTAFCGPIAFIGLSVPHISRMLMRTNDYRLLLPATVLMGSMVALACNFMCNLPGNKGIIPINAVTPLIGAPVVIYVIMRKAKFNLH